MTTRRSFFQLLTSVVVASAVEIWGWKPPGPDQLDVAQPKPTKTRSTYCDADTQRLIEMLESDGLHFAKTWTLKTPVNGLCPTWDWNGFLWVRRKGPEEIPPGEWVKRPYYTSEPITIMDCRYEDA